MNRAVVRCEPNFVLRKLFLREVRRVAMMWRDVVDVVQ